MTQASRRLARAMLVAGIGLAGALGIVSAQTRLTPRALADAGVIALPSALQSEHYPGATDELMHRMAYQFGVPYLWASWGSVTRYKQLMVVSVLAADADEAAYDARPRGWLVSYDRRGPGRASTLGSGRLEVTEGTYALGVDREASVEYFYIDRARRLQILWHTVKSQQDPAAAPELLRRIAESFKLQHDPAPVLAERRAAPGREAAERERRRAAVRAMLVREGYGAPQPGQPIWRRGAWLEWMADPEPRYQLLVPLGRMRAAAPGVVVNRPRPLNNGSGPSGIGWREYADGQWTFSNREQAYLPMQGIAAQLAARQQDIGEVYFYFAGTVRVDEEADPERLNSLDWFFAALPDVQRRWREGSLVGPGQPASDPWPR